MKEFFTSDHHFSHGSVLKFDMGRNFENVHEMNKHLINEWNSVVSEGDTVYHLGDLFWNKKAIITILNEYLNGDIVWILGNHDKLKDANKIKLACPKIKEITYYKELKRNNIHLVLMHYPIQEWNRKHYGSIHLHGHSHGKCPIMKNRVDVGIDNIGYKPNLLEQLIEIVNKQNQLIEL